MNNKDGKFDELLALMENNPNMNYADVIDYIEKNNKNGQFNDLKNYINDAKNLKYINEYMKKNNLDNRF